MRDAEGDAVDGVDEAEVVVEEDGVLEPDGDAPVDDGEPDDIPSLEAGADVFVAVCSPVGAGVAEVADESGWPLDSDPPDRETRVDGGEVSRDRVGVGVGVDGPECQGGRMSPVA